MMTREEFLQLPPEEQEMLMLQMQQAQTMRQEPQQGGGMNPAMAMNFIPEAGGSGGGGGGAMAGMAAPAALAAVIIGNETYQNQTGNRPDDFSDQLKEGFTGESLERDVERYLGDGPVAEHLGQMGNPKGLLKNMKQGLKPWEWF
jgi:hypothetical protein